MKEIRLSAPTRAVLVGAALVMCIVALHAPLAGGSIGASLSSRGATGANLAAGAEAQARMSAAAAALAAGSAEVSGSAQSATSSTVSVLQRFSPLYMGGSTRYTAAQAIAIAQHFTILAEHSGVFTPFISVMKAANPSLRIVAYINGAFDQSSGGTTYPSTWYAHDMKGNRIRSVSFGNWLMSPTATWSSTVASKCKSTIAASKYDGCFLDTLGIGPLLPGYVTGVPIDPLTKKVYTAVTWIKAQSGTVSAVAGANPGAVIVTNGLANGSKYFAAGGPTSPLLAASHVAMAEIFLRVSKNSVNAYPSLTNWKMDVDMLANAESHGWGVMTTVKLWTSASAAQQASWHKFALATFLLGAGVHCGFSFSTAKTDAALSAISPWDTAAIGTPTGAYGLVGGAYQRSFSHGLSIVNPGTSSVTVKFTKPYVNLNGSVVTSETLAAHSGDVLVG
jgi:hypothetical protein